jgi:hypothetical protein
MLQKLVTVFLHDQAPEGSKYGDPAGNPFFGVCSHLDEYLERGWQVKELITMSGAGKGASGWVVVLLEK